MILYSLARPRRIRIFSAPGFNRLALLLPWQLYNLFFLIFLISLPQLGQFIMNTSFLIHLQNLLDLLFQPIHLLALPYLSQLLLLCYSNMSHIFFLSKFHFLTLVHILNNNLPLSLSSNPWYNLFIEYFLIL